MNGTYISAFAHSTVIELSQENKVLFEMLGEFAENCELEGRSAVKLNGNSIESGDCCGFIRLVDGTLIEILPNVQSDDINAARENLCRSFCSRIGYGFGDSRLSESANFMEYFISVFAAESMKIIKSGVLSAYLTREENMTSVQGTIMFAENMRKNLTHRERLYVRHEVFSPDRAENRLMKAAAQKLMKLTEDPRSSQLLKQVTAFLDEVKPLRNPAEEFSKCVNTRNTKKYSAVLEICRMLFDRHTGTAFSGKYVSCALLFDSVCQDLKI